MNRQKSRPIRRKPAPKPKEARKQNSSNAFGRLYQQYGQWIFAALLVGTAFYVFKNYLFGLDIYLFKDIASDSINTNYPTYYHIADYLREYGYPGWSFNQGMGQSIFKNIFQPFQLLLFAAGPDKLASTVAWAEVLKVIASGLLIFLYLRTMKMSKYTASIGGLLYAFSGVMILGSGWHDVSYKVFLFAFLLFAFERLLLTRQWFFFPLAIALIGNVFFIFIFGLFLFIYSIFRYMQTEQAGLRGYLFLLGKMAGLGALGMLLTFVFLYPGMEQMLGSSRAGGGESAPLKEAGMFSTGSFHHNMTIIYRFFSNDLMRYVMVQPSDYPEWLPVKTAEQAQNLGWYQIWYNYLEAPIFYCGLLTLLLVPQVFRFLSRRERIIYGVFLGLWFLPLVFPWFRHAMNLFAGNYFRTSIDFILPFVLIFFAARSLQLILRERKVNFIILGLTLAGLLLLLLYPFEYGSPEGLKFPDAFQPHLSGHSYPVDTVLRGYIIVFLLIHTALIALLALPRFRDMAKALLLIALVVELGFMGYTTTSRVRTPMTKAEHKAKTGYNDYTVDALQWIAQNDPAAFYRVNKEYQSGPTMHGSLNDAKVQGYYGTASYSSFNQESYLDFLRQLQVINPKDPNALRWAPGLKARPLLLTWASNKYNLSRKPQSFFQQFGYKKVQQVNDVSVYRNMFYLPLGYAYDQYLSREQFDQIAPQGKPKQYFIAPRDMALMQAVVVDQNTISELEGMSPANLQELPQQFAGPWYEQRISALRKDTLAIESFTPNHIGGSITLEQAKLLFFSIPFDKGWSATVNGKAAKLIRANIGFTGLYLPAGEHYVELSYSVPSLSWTIWVTVLAWLVFIGLVALSIIRKRKAARA